MEIYKKNTWNVYNYASNGKDYEIFNLRFYSIYQLFQSNHLKIDTENIALGFLYHYSRLLMAKQPSKSTFSYITDFLATSLRFSHMATSKILSSLRDSEHLRNSKLFIAKVQDEFLTRA